MLGLVHYGMCAMLFVTAPSPAERTAQAHFAQAAKYFARDDVAAAREYLTAAETLRRSPTHADGLTIYNRRVAYADAVNSLLSMDRVRAARAMLLAAAAQDRDLASDLRRAAKHLPEPMACAPPAP